MTASDFAAAAPLLVLAAAAVALMLLIALRRNHALAAFCTAVSFVAALAALAFGTLPHLGRAVTPLLVVDGYAVFYMALVLLSGLAVSVLSYGYLRLRPSGAPPEEYYLLLLLASLGAATTVASDHFAAFFLGLETLSVSLLALIAYPHTSAAALEAAVKYLILAGAASAFLLFGIALVYAATGTLSFAPATLADDAEPGAVYWLAGIALLLVGIGFKLSVVPFHLWAPDVYEGAPAPVTAFLAVVSKCAVFALLLRYFLAAEAFAAAGLTAILATVAVASMLAGNLAALLQTNVKRILAYSSIAHLGYALVALLAAGAAAVEAVSLYLAMYAITTLGAFAVVTLLSPAGSERDADALEDYRGLFWVRPWLALAFSAMLLSLAGIPLTLGFIGKFYVLSAAADAGMWMLAGALIVGSVIGLYYYLRVIVVMLGRASAEEPRSARIGLWWPSQALLVVLAAALLGFGAYPAPLVSVVRASTLIFGEHGIPLARPPLAGMPRAAVPR